MCHKPLDIIGGLCPLGGEMCIKFSLAHFTRTQFVSKGAENSEHDMR